MTDRKSIENRYDFTILFDVKDGNPNGDPDSGNMPRVDIETGNGLVTDVCIKRKIRDYVQTAMGEQTPWRIYIQNRRTLNRLDSEALEAEHIDARPEDKDFAKEIKSLKKDDPTLDLRLRDYMCSQFFDIRTFGAVMTTFVKGSLSCGQVRGPVQLGFARSIDPVSVQEISLTRIAVTTEADAADKNNTMGNKFIIPYGLYRMNGYISAKLAQNVTGFCDEDLDMLWQAILNMFEFDRSAARGDTLIMRDLRVFSRHLGITGACDVVEFHQSDDGVPLRGRNGLWSAYPIEYKHGQSKTVDADRLQLCAEAMCLEEMLSCEIVEGALFYQRTRRRERVELTEELRGTVVAMVQEMHQLFSRGHTPRVKPRKACSACSLKDICLPELLKAKSAEQYIHAYVNEETS